RAALPRQPPPAPARGAADRRGPARLRPGGRRAGAGRRRGLRGRHPAGGGLVDAVVHRGADKAAQPGLITSSMIASRSSKGRNADFIALMVNHRSSSTPQPNASARACISLVIEVLLISRLSVLTV